MSVINAKRIHDVPNPIDGHEQRIKSEANSAEAERNAMNEPPSSEPNPFDMMKYQQFNKGNDAIVAPGASMAESLLSDDTVPEDIKEKFWFVFHKDNVLTFLDKERKISKLLNFDIMKIDQLNCMPYYNYNFDFEFQLNIIRNVYETKLDRALGTTNAVKNERTTLQSQFSEVKSINEVSQGDVSTTGFFKRLLNRR